MANENIYSSYITLANAVSGMMSPAFVNGSQGLPLVVTEVFPDNSNTVKLPIAGTLTAATLAEATDYSYSSSSQLTDTSITVVAKKVAVGSRLSVEADRFAKPWANVPRIAAEQGKAMSRLFDADLKALFSSVTNAVTASTTLVKDNVLDARYNIESSMKGAYSGKLVAMLHFKGVNELRKDITSISAPAWSNTPMLGILGTPTPGNGFAGNILGVDIYQCDGMPTGSGDNVQCVWDPSMAFYAGLDGVGGFRSSIEEPKANNAVTYAILSWTFWKVAQYRDTAACRLNSDS